MALYHAHHNCCQEAKWSRGVERGAWAHLWLLWRPILDLPISPNGAKGRRRDEGREGGREKREREREYENEFWRGKKKKRKQGAEGRDVLLLSGSLGGKSFLASAAGALAALGTSRAGVRGPLQPASTRPKGALKSPSGLHSILAAVGRSGLWFPSPAPPALRAQSALPRGRKAALSQSDLRSPRPAIAQSPSFTPIHFSSAASGTGRLTHSTELRRMPGVEAGPGGVAQRWRPRGAPHPARTRRG